MELKLQHPEIYDLHVKMITLIKKGGKLIKEKETMEMELNKLGLQIQKLKDKINPLVKAAVANKLSEFQIVTKVDTKGGNNHEVLITVADQVEDFKKYLREQQAKQQPNENTPNKL
jgi:hypothetical protein